MGDDELRLGKSEGSAEDALKELERMLGEARVRYAQRNPRGAAETLSAGEALAQQHQLYRQASVLRKALAILSSGGKPRLLTRATATLLE
jgi:hypothetical protein